MRDSRSDLVGSLFTGGRHCWVRRGGFGSLSSSGSWYWCALLGEVERVGNVFARLGREQGP
jgi:hypothetical protein